MSGKEPLVMVGLGEILWDMLPEGKKLGGAPANFIFHCHQLGHKGFIASRIGCDSLGNEIDLQLKALQLPTSYLQQDKIQPTGTVSVTLDTQGQPSYTIHKPAAWDFIEENEALRELCQMSDLICYGSLGQRDLISRQTIQTLLKNAGIKTLKLCDINLRQHFYNRELVMESLAAADILKLNDQELPVVAQLCGETSQDTASQMKYLREKFNLKLVCLTRGENGCVLINAEETVEHKGFTTRVKDTVGAGDAFTAAMAHLYLNKAELSVIAEMANKVGAFVASQSGGTPLWPESLRDEILMS